MNHVKAACGHMTLAIGAPGSAARAACMKGLCVKCEREKSRPKENP